MGTECGRIAFDALNLATSAAILLGLPGTCLLMCAALGLPVGVTTGSESSDLFGGLPASVDLSKPPAFASLSFF